MSAIVAQCESSAKASEYAFTQEHREHICKAFVQAAAKFVCEEKQDAIANWDVQIDIRRAIEEATGKPGDAALWTMKLTKADDSRTFAIACKMSEPVTIEPIAVI